MVGLEIRPSDVAHSIALPTLLHPNSVVQGQIAIYLNTSQRSQEKTYVLPIINSGAHRSLDSEEPKTLSKACWNWEKSILNSCSVRASRCDSSPELSPSSTWDCPNAVNRFFTAANIAFVFRSCVMNTSLVTIHYRKNLLLKRLNDLQEGNLLTKFFQDFRHASNNPSTKVHIVTENLCHSRTSKNLASSEIQGWNTKPACGFLSWMPLPLAHWVPRVLLVGWSQPSLFPCPQEVQSPSQMESRPEHLYCHLL